MSNNYFSITPDFWHCGFMGKPLQFLQEAERITGETSCRGASWFLVWNGGMALKP